MFIVYNHSISEPDCPKIVYQAITRSQCLQYIKEQYITDIQYHIQEQNIENNLNTEFKTLLDANPECVSLLERIRNNQELTLNQVEILVDILDVVVCDFQIGEIIFTKLDDIDITMSNNDNSSYDHTKTMNMCMELHKI